MAKSKAINVKIATAKVIKALETKLAQIKKNKAEQKNNEAKFQKAMEKWQKEVGKLALANINKAESLSASTRYNKDVYISFTLPAGTITLPDEPERDFEVVSDYNYRDTVDEIENAIRILKMTDEEVVSTSTYNTIARYL